MKQTAYILNIVYLLLIITLCKGMELPYNKKLRAEFLSNNNIIILSKRQCSIIDLTTEKKILEIKNLSDHDLIIHPNNKNFALFKGQCLTIYNIKTNTKEKISINDDCIRSAIFSPLEKTIFLNCMDTLQKYNYKDNYRESVSFDINQDIMHHPTQPCICILKNQKILIKNSTTFALQEKFRLYRTSSLINCQYSPNGSIIAANSSQDIYFFYPNSNQCTHVIRNEPDECIKQLIFHPNGSIFVTLHVLSTKKHAIRYWDLATLACIKTSYFKKYIYHLSFSPNGDNILITQSNQYSEQSIAFVIQSLPWQATYELDTPKKLLFLPFLFKNHKKNIPQKIIQNIQCFLLEKLKR